MKIPQAQFSVNLDFQQIIQLVIQLPTEYRVALFEMLQQQIETEKTFNDTVKGTLNIEKYRKKGSEKKNWSNIEKKWPGDENDTQINQALAEIS